MRDISPFLFCIMSHTIQTRYYLVGSLGLMDLVSLMVPVALVGPEGLVGLGAHWVSWGRWSGEKFPKIPFFLDSVPY